MKPRHLAVALWTQSSRLTFLTLSAVLAAAISALLMAGCCSNPPVEMGYLAKVLGAATREGLADEPVLVYREEIGLEGQALQDFLDTAADGWLDEDISLLPPWVRRTDANGQFIGTVPLVPIPSDWRGCPDPEALGGTVPLAIDRLYMWVRIAGRWEGVVVEFSEDDRQYVDSYGFEMVVLPEICVSAEGVQVCE